LVLAGATAGVSLLLGSLAILIGVALIIRWPIAGFYVVVGLVTLIEQEPLSTSILTDRLPVFYWPPSLEGVIERPIGLLFIFIFLVFVGQRLLRRQRPLCAGPLLVPFSLFLLCISGGVILGLSR